MTDQELHDAILASAQAKAMADAGDDNGAAMAVAPTLTPITVDAYVGELGILAVLGPGDGDTALTNIEAASAQSSLLARVVRLLRSPAGLNLGDPMTQAQLDALVTQGVLTQVWVNALKAHATEQPLVTAEQVSRAWAQYRPDGRIVTGAI